MFELALLAGIPIVGVSSDDEVHALEAVQLIAGVKPLQLLTYSTTWAASWVPSSKLYYTRSMDFCNVGVYSKLEEAGSQLLVFNPTPNPLVFDGGELPTPPQMVSNFLAPIIPVSERPEYLRALKGLSLKTVKNIVHITQARTGGTELREVRRTRTSLMGTQQGLVPMDTYLSFYECPPELDSYLKLNKPWFLSPTTHPKLMPRGLMLLGPPGTGKSLAAKKVAIEFGVPLYRLDIATVLDRYVGVSENRIARILDQVDREEPCVLLIDEVEKVFRNGNDQEVMQRILSQMLWWLSEHTSRVFTLMTTNDETKIPAELFREGRVDSVLTFQELTSLQARLFSHKVYESVLGEPITMERGHALASTLPKASKETLSQAQVCEMVYSAIKKNQWAQP